MRLYSDVGSSSNQCISQTGLSVATRRLFLGDPTLCYTGTCEFFLMCWLGGGLIDGGCGGFLFACCSRPNQRGQRGHQTYRDDSIGLIPVDYGPIRNDQGATRRQHPIPFFTYSSSSHAYETRQNPSTLPSLFSYILQALPHLPSSLDPFLFLSHPLRLSFSRQAAVSVSAVASPPSEGSWAGRRLALAPSRGR